MLDLASFDYRNPDYSAVFARRLAILRSIRTDKSGATLAAFRRHYEFSPVDFINDWMITYDPRRKDAKTIPLILFKRQRELVHFFHECSTAGQNGLIEKARDMGATWVASAFSVWLWAMVPGAAVGWGSRKEALVDKIGDPDSIFEKIRILIRAIPPEFRPRGFSAKDDMPFMRILNRETGATITGEAGDNIGRGGRKMIYFKDESAHYERPEKIEAALADNTNCQIDFSSVNGPGNVFHRRREAGTEWVPGQALATDRTNVFIMDWRDHPLKDQQWYDQRRAKAEGDGLLHVFKQEVDRDYLSSVAGVIIRPEWVLAAIDAHVKLGWAEGGVWGAGLDVADEGPDLNALALRQGVVLRRAEDWSDRDAGVVARKAVEACRPLGNVAVQYDCIGVGATVKAEANRLAETPDPDEPDRMLLPKGLAFVPWAASASPLWKERRVDPDDDESPRHEILFANLKAQGWWMLARRFEKTFNAVTKGQSYPMDEMISLPSDLPKLQTIRKELSQATRGSSGALRMVVNKSPEGTRSPNIADAIMMAYHPLPTPGYTLEGW